MFVPRALRLRGVKEKPKPAKANASPAAKEKDGNISRCESIGEAQRKLKVESLVPESKNGDSKTERGPRFNSGPVTPEYMAQLAAGIELIFTDYAHHEPESSKWLQERLRTVGGEDNYVHLSAILEHSNITSLNPQATQILLRQALQEHATGALELSSNGFYVRRRPSTYPLPFVPPNSFSVTDDDGLSFWDQRTIYVEPHIRHLCRTPAKVAHWLAEHGKLKPKWLPVQAVLKPYNSCAFVVISGNVTHEDPWNKWRNFAKPEDWKIMTKVEHGKRTEEYLELLKQNKAKMKKQRKDRTSAAAAQATSPKAAPEANLENGQPVSKKRKRTEEDA